MINGSSAPAGSVFRAYSNSTLVGQVIIQEPGIYGYAESTKQKLLVGETSNPITFTIQHPSLNSGAEIVGTVSKSFVSGSTTQEDFAFSFTTQAPATTGGGGSPTVVPASNQLSVEAQKADSNSDGKVDVLDFNSLMVNWGKNEANNQADANQDGKVDIFDFNLLMVHWTG